MDVQAASTIEARFISHLRGLMDMQHPRHSLTRNPRFKCSAKEVQDREIGGCD
jgi:hypothetical protein